MSMNTTGVKIMKGCHGRILGQTSHDLFDSWTADNMVQSDYYVMDSKKVHTFTFNTIDKQTETPYSIFTAKSAILSPSGDALGVVGISLVNYNGNDLLPEMCRLLPRFIQKRRHHLVNELLELRTVLEFSKIHQLH